jgi:glutamate mutase epsilon subunit
LVNESLALTQEDKIKIINGFKKVDTIAESQIKYKEFLTEMKSNKKTLTESIEGKVSASVAPSSKQSLDEAKEVTAYANNEHINKMKRIIEYVEKNRSKKII